MVWPTTPEIEDRLTIEPPPFAASAAPPPRCPENASAVDRHHPLPQAGVEQVVGRAAGYPGVVHQDVQPAELRHRLIDDVLPTGFIRDVQTMKTALPPVALISICNGLALALQHVGDDDLRPLLAEPPGCCSAHA